MCDDLLPAKSVHNLAFRVFQRYFAELCQALSSDTHQIAREMFSKELISKETMSNAVETLGIPPSDKAGILVGAMANKIAAENSSKPLVSFCRLLERRPVVGSIASRMKARLAYAERHHQLPGDEWNSETESEKRPSSCGGQPMVGCSSLDDEEIVPTMKFTVQLHITNDKKKDTSNTFKIEEPQMSADTVQFHVTDDNKEGIFSEGEQAEHEEAQDPVDTGKPCQEPVQDLCEVVNSHRPEIKHSVSLEPCAHIPLAVALCDAELITSHTMEVVKSKSTLETRNQTDMILDPALDKARTNLQDAMKLLFCLRKCGFKLIPQIESISPTLVIGVTIGDDVTDKLCCLAGNFTATTAKYAESYSMLLKGKIEILQDHVMSLLLDATYGEIFSFPRIFLKMQLQEKIDVFNIELLKMLLVVERNNIAKLAITYYNIQREEFLGSVIIEDYANAIQGAAAVQRPEGCFEIEMKLVRISDQWPQKRLKEIKTLINHVYGKYSKFPTRPQVTHGVVVFKWCSSEETKAEVKRRTKEHHDYLKSKGCEVTVDGEPMVKYSLIEDIREAADHVCELKREVDNWIEATSKLLEVLEAIAEGPTESNHEIHGGLLYRPRGWFRLPGWVYGSPNHCSICAEKVEKDVQLALGQLPIVLDLAERLNECLKTSKLPPKLRFLTYMFSGKFTQEESLSIVLDACKCEHLEDIERLIAQPTRRTRVPDLTSYIINPEIITSNNIGDRYMGEARNVAKQSKEKAEALKKCVEKLKTLPFM